MIIGMDDISSNWFFNKLDFIKLMSVSIHSYVFMQDIYQCNWFSGSCFPLKMLNRIWKYMYTAICRARFKIPLIFQLGDSLVFISSMLNLNARHFAGIRDVPPKHPRSMTALQLAELLCRHQRNAAFLTIILHVKINMHLLKIFIYILISWTQYLHVWIVSIHLLQLSLFSHLSQLSHEEDALTSQSHTAIWLNKESVKIFYQQRCYSIACT